MAAAWILLGKGTDSNVQANVNGGYELRMNKLYLVVGLSGLIIGLILILTFPLLAEELSVELFLILGLILLVFWGTGLTCLLYFVNHKVRFNKDSVEVVDVYGRKKEILWSEISEASFNTFSGLLKFQSSKTTVKVHHHLVGLNTLIGVMENQTKWDRKSLKIPVRP